MAQSSNEICCGCNCEKEHCICPETPPGKRGRTPEEVVTFPDVPPQGWLNAFRTEVEAAVAPVVSRVIALESNMEGLASDLKSVKVHIAELERRQSLYESGNAPGRKHIPTYIEIKGFCTFEGRSSEGVGRDQAAILVNRLSAMLLSDAKESLGVPKLPITEKVHSIRIPLLKQEHLSTIRETWRSAFDVAENQWNGHKLRVVVEPDENTKAKYSSFGRLKNFSMIRLGERIDYSMKDFWAPDYIIFLEPSNQIQKPVQLAVLEISNEVKWSKEGLAILGVDSFEQANHGLLAARHFRRA